MILSDAVLDAIGWAISEGKVQVVGERVIETPIRATLRVITAAHVFLLFTRQECPLPVLASFSIFSSLDVWPIL